MIIELGNNKNMNEKEAAKTYNINGAKVQVAATAGFCFGVDLAVSEAEKLLDAGKKVVTWGPLIHNPQVISSLEKRGVKVAEKLEDIPKDATVLIRSHGVSQKIEQELLANSENVVDATCPFVTKIHKIAKKSEEDNAVLLVAGDKNHPEVMGIVGHTSGKVAVFEDLQQLKDVLLRFSAEKLVYVVAQTTYEVTKWLEYADFIKKVCTKCLVFDTICSATWARQEEAEDMARHHELMLVVGGHGSSNTRKLCKVAAKHTRALQIESPDELNAKNFDGIGTIGITAGASTPLSAIEEVLTRMSDVIRDGEMSFEEMLEESMRPVHAGQIVKGVVEAVSVNEVTVDIGTKHTGIIKLEELTDDPAVRSAEEVVKRGDEIEVVVVKVNDQEGIVQLSKRQMEARKGAEELAKAAEDGTIMDGYVTESNKGGLVALVKGVRVFIPASQATERRGEDYTELVRKHVRLVIREFSPRRTIGSVRDVFEAENKIKRDAFWEDTQEGKVYIGTVKSLTNYGAFVDIGGLDGLVHISELSWSRIKHPSEVLKEGDTVEVYIKEMDRVAGRISLGYKKQEDNPWEKLRSEFPAGTTFEAEVVNIKPFGAFVRILPGIDGLIHISEISYDHIEKVSDALQIGNKVEVKLLDVDYDKKRISLSMKALLPVPEEKAMSAEDEMVASASAEGTAVSEELAKEVEEAEETVAKAVEPVVETISETVETEPVETAKEKTAE